MSTSSARRVVVTGLGATTPLGGDVPSTWQAALKGTPGAATLDEGWDVAEDFPVAFAAKLASPVSTVLSRGQIQRLDPSGQMALVASLEAWADSGLAGAEGLDGERLGVVIASGIGGVWTLLTAYDTYREKGHRRVFPLTVPMLMPNGPAAAVALELGARAGVHTPVSACASGAESVAMGADMIRNGRADVVLAGGTEAAIHPLNIAAFNNMQALSTRNDDPAGASRPYDVDRDGFVMGEGAAVLVLEEAEHARARGATIYAEVAGAGLTSDAYHIAAPDPNGSGAARAMRAALEAADLSASDVVHLNAHATSTPAGDVAEAQAVASALGAHVEQVSVSATKSMTGHLLGAAGALESVFTVLALRDRLAPPSINIATLDPQISLNIAQELGGRPLGEGDLAALNNSFGFGGHNVALVFTTS